MERIDFTRCSGVNENFFRRYALRSSYLTALVPWASSHAAICGKIASGSAARTWSAWVEESFTFLILNWTSARRNQIAVSTVEKAGSRKLATTVVGSVESAS